MIYGYINPTQTPKQDAERIAAIMHRLGCKTIFEEETTDNNERPVWFYVMKELQINDTLVIPKVNQSLQGITELPLFLNHCSNNNLRLISIMDNIDTDCQIYDTTVTDYINMVTSFIPCADEDDNAKEKKRKKKQNGKPLKSIEQLITKRQKELRDCEIVNLYNAGYAIAKIMEHCGFKTKRAVFYILQQHGVNPDRCRPRSKSPKKSYLQKRNNQ